MAPAPAAFAPAPAAFAPVPAAFAPAPAAFHEVSQHEEGEAHRPTRKRRHEAAGTGAEPAAPLELIETQSEKAQAAAFVEDELPRRTKPRRRRHVDVETGPLQLVETAAAPETPRDPASGG